MGAVNQFNKFLPNLAAKSYSLRSIVKKGPDWIWNNDHETALVRINEEIKKNVELSNFKETTDLDFFAMSTLKLSILSLIF